jgi:hypothetical protein
MPVQPALPVTVNVMFETVYTTGVIPAVIINAVRAAGYKAVPLAIVNDAFAEDKVGTPNA